MKRLAFIKLIFIPIFYFAQPPKRFYTKFGGNGVDIGYSAKPTKDGHYIVAGSTSSYGAGNTDVYLVKVDSMGFPIWQKTFGGFNNDVGKSVIQLSDSGYVITGYTNSFGAGGYDVYLIRTDKNGNLLWQKTFGGTDWDFGNDLVFTSDYNIAVVGNTSSFGNGKKDGLFVKFDLAGNIVQQKFIGGAENDELKSIIITNDNFLAAVGYTESKGEIKGDSYFLKMDFNGDTLFTKTFGSIGKDYANDLVQRVDNSDYIICGAKTYTSSVNTESFMYSITSTGAFSWEYHDTKDPNTNEEFFSNCSVGFYPTYTTYLRNWSKPSFKMQAAIWVGMPFGFFVNGTEEGGSEDEYGYSIESTPDGGYVTVGVTYSYGSVNGDVYFLKQDSTTKNNANLVNIEKNNPSNTKPILKYLSQKEIELYTESNIKHYKIITLNGNIVSQSDTDSSNLRIDLNLFPTTLLVLEVQLKNGLIFHFKITNS